jgi:hypothetical protein
MTPSRVLTLVGTALLALCISSCKSTPKAGGGRFSPSFVPSVKSVSNPSAVKVKISTGAQRVYVMEGDKVLLATPCSVGTSSDPTPSGTHRITEKTMTRRRVSSPGAGYPMTFWMSFAGPAYGMHWGWVKPYPCTHGCVRLPIKSAKAIFDMVRVGTPVTVARSHPEDSTAGASLPVLDDSALSDPPDSYMHSSRIFDDARQGKIYNY